MVFLVLLIPLLLMVFALLMERLEHRLRTTTMSEQDVEEFLDKAQPEEVNTFIREGWTRALSMFWRRNRRPSNGPRPRLFTGSRSATRPASRSSAAAARSASRPAPEAASGSPSRAPSGPASAPARPRTPDQDGRHPTI